MPQTAINKPIYDAFVDAGASEEKATLAACAVLPSVDEAATKTDITLLSSAIERLEEVMTAAITGLKKDNERLKADMMAAINQLRADTKADINQLKADTKADIAESKVDLLKWIAGMLGVAVAAIGLIVKLLLGGLPLGG